MIKFFIFLRQELLISSKNMSQILANSLFFIISLVIFLILTSKNDNLIQKNIYFFAFLWISIISSLIFSSNNFLKKDYEDGSLEQIYINSISHFEIFIFARNITNWIIYSLPIIVISLFFLNNYEINLKNSALILIFSSLIINQICSFCGILSISGNSSSLISIIALPLIIPAIIFANSALIYNEIFAVKFLIFLLIFLSPITVFLSSKIVKISID
jgi:heme exporter protein CcmB